MANEVVPRAACRELARSFDAKVDFIRDHGDIQETESRVLKKLHKYRNELCHRDRVRPETVQSACLLYFDMACTLFERLAPVPVHDRDTPRGAAGAMFWQSRITEHSTYAGGLLGPMLPAAAGLGLLFVPMSLVSLTKVTNNDTGVASSLLNVGQQVGGSVGLAILGTVAWTAVANSLRSQAAAAKAAMHTSAAKTAVLQTRMYDHALATGFSRGFIVSAGIAVLALIITLAAIRVTREDLAGVDLMPAPIG